MGIDILSHTCKRILRMILGIIYRICQGKYLAKKALIFEIGAFFMIGVLFCFKGERLPQFGGGY